MMRKGFLLLTALTLVGAGLQQPKAQPSRAESPSDVQENSPPGHSRESAFPDRPWEQIPPQEREHWRRRRFWEVFEPSGAARFDTPELYLERYATRNIIDPKVNLFEVEVKAIPPKGVRIQGKVQWQEYADGLRDTFRTLGFDPVEDSIAVLPAPELGEERFGLSTTHTLSIRRFPQPKAEQMNSVAFGDGVRLLEQSPDGQWFRVVAPDGYVGWARAEHIRRIKMDGWNRWIQSPRWARTLQPIRIFDGDKELAVVPATAALPLLDQGADEPSRRLIGEIIVIQKRKRRAEAAGQETATRESATTPAPVAAGSGEKILVRLPFAPPLDRAAIPKSAVQIFAIPGEPMLKEIHRIADPLLGVPYVWGGISETGVDCSGFTQYVYRVMGIALARDADEQTIGGRLVWSRGESFDSVRPGDLFFFLSRDGRVSHVALSLGGREYIHASGGQVSLGSFDPDSPGYNDGYMKKLAFAKRCRFGEID